MTFSQTSEAPPRKHYRARLLSKTEVAPHHFQFDLHCREIAQQAKPGQFVHVLPGLTAFDGSFDPLLRRAFSIMRVEGENFSILFRALGRGTQILSGRAVGETVDLLGPLGNGFDLSLFHVKQGARAILVGGGVGVPPMVFLSHALKNLGAKPQMILGARGAGDVICESEFGAQNVPVLLRTEDGSRGQQGRVTDALKQLLQDLQVSNEGQDSIQVFACGPYPMLRAIAQLCEEYGVNAQVSLEENMPCGVGVCNGCVVPVRGAENDYEKYRRVCVHGPVCDAEEIEWN